MNKDHVVGSFQMGNQTRSSLLSDVKPSNQLSSRERESAQTQLKLELDDTLQKQIKKEFLRGQTGNVTGGGLVDYYLIEVKYPQRGGPSCVVECDDLIEALQLSFDEGEIFKEIWRTACARLGTGKPGNTLIRSREKILHRANRLMKQAKNSL